MLLSRVQEQVRISHRAIDSIHKTAGLEKDAMVLRAQEQVRDSLLQSEKNRLQKKAFMNQVRLLQGEVERLNSEKQQGCESLAGDIASALISSDDDASVENEWLTPVATRGRRLEIF